MRLWRKLAVLTPLMLAGCSVQDLRLLFPAGPMAAVEFHYTWLMVVTMLIVIVPTLLMTIIFPIFYHHSFTRKYTPNWDFSATVEVLAWGIPLVIVGVLSYLTIAAVNALDPWNPPALAGLGGTEAPINVQVIATDWQWVFVYPDQKIATIDELVVPAGRRVNLVMTATSNMDGFYIPQVAPMVDAMPAMQTKNAFIIDKPGSFTGFSTDYSGAGFAWMQFETKAVSDADFATWVARVQASPNALDYALFNARIAPPQVNYGAKISEFTLADPKLYDEVIAAAYMGKLYPVPPAISEAVNVAAAAPAAP